MYATRPRKSTSNALFLLTLAALTFSTSSSYAQEHHVEAFPVFAQVTSPTTGVLQRLPYIEQSALTISRIDGDYVASNGWLTGTPFRTVKENGGAVCLDPICAREKAPIIVSNAGAPIGANDFNRLLKKRQATLAELLPSMRLSTEARVDSTRVQRVPESFQKLISDMLAHAAPVLRSGEMEALAGNLEATLEEGVRSLIDTNKAAFIAANYNLELEDVIRLASQRIAQDIKNEKVTTPAIINPFFRHQEVSINDPVLSVGPEVAVKASYSFIQRIIDDYCEKSIEYWRLIAEDQLFTENDRTTANNWLPPQFRAFSRVQNPEVYIVEECDKFNRNVMELDQQIAYAAALAFERISNPAHRSDQTEAVVRAATKDFLARNGLPEDRIELWTQTGVNYYDRLVPFLAEQVLKNSVSRSGFATARQQVLQGVAGSAALMRSEVFLASIAGAAAKEMALTLFAMRPFQPLNLRHEPLLANAYLNSPGFDFDNTSAVAMEAGEELNPLDVTRTQPDYNELEELALNVEFGELYPAKAAREVRRWHAQVRKSQKYSKFLGFDARVRALVEAHLERLESWRETELAHEALQEMVSSVVSFNHSRGIDGVSTGLVFGTSHAWLPNDTRVDTVLVKQGDLVVAGEPIITTRHKYLKRAVFEFESDEFHSRPVRIGDKIRSSASLTTSHGTEVEFHINVDSIEFVEDAMIRMIGKMYPVVATNKLVGENTQFGKYSMVTDHLCDLFPMVLNANSCLEIENRFKGMHSTILGERVVGK